MVLRTKQDDFPRYQVGDMVIKAAGLQSIGLSCPHPLRLRSPFGPVLGSMSNSRMQDRYMREKLCIPVDALEQRGELQEQVRELSELVCLLSYFLSVQVCVLHWHHPLCA